MLQHSCPSFNSTFNQGLSSGEISGLPTTRWDGSASHDTVNCSVTFVAPSVVHIQNVESYWNRIKHKFKMKGCHREMLPSYLDEYMWGERHGPTSHQAFASLCRDIKDQYPV